MWRAGVLGCCSFEGGKAGHVGCPAFLLGLRSILVARDFYLKILTRRLEQSSAAELFALSARVDVTCWRFGLLEI